MILAVDIGNSNIVIGCFDKSSIIFMERLTTNHTATQLEYAVNFKNVLELYNVSPCDIEGGIISSVVPPVTGTVREALSKIIDGDIMIVDKDFKKDFTIKIDNPETLGSDRIVDAQAAVSEYPLPIIIIDLGTATTISVINEEREYLGGMIMPGVRISLQALTSRTAKLPEIGLDKPKKLIGSNTIECMKSGLLYGNASCIDGMIDRIENETAKKYTVVATGGLSDRIIPLCRHEIITDDKLLLKGLRLLYNKNKE